MNIETALLNTVLGMGTVFLVLVFISFIIWLLGWIIQTATGSAKKKTVQPQAQVAAPKAAPKAEPKKEAVIQKTDDNELVAVITAAIAASMSETAGQVVSPDGFVVRSIKKRR
ncbi:MAG: OadG family protein [Lachnospiraceae bacterium]|nr:OadG family protein [Lachnospiraceae bacterium]